MAVFLLAMVAVSLYLVLSPDRSSPADTVADVLALTLVWVASVPLLRFVLLPRGTPFFGILGVLYAVYFGLPRFGARPLFSTLRYEPPPSAVTEALATALLGVLALVTSYLGSAFLMDRIPRVKRRPDLRRCVTFFAVYGCLAPVVTVASRSVRLPASLGQPITLLQLSGEVCIGGILLAALRGEAPRWAKAAFVGIVAADVLAGVLTGALAIAVWPLAGLVVLYGWQRRRLPFGVVLVGSLAFVPLNAAKFEYRRLAPAMRADPLDRAKLFASSLEHVFQERSFGQMADSANARLNYLRTLGTVVYQTPMQVPYWAGESYATLPWHLVPRVLVPDKPTFESGQVFPRRYGLLDYEDTQTSYNFPYLLEFYANFGNAGVVIGMMIVAFIFRLLEHAFAADVGGVLMIAPLYSRLLNVESDFTNTFGGLPLFLVFLYAFVRLLPGTGYVRQ